MALDHYQSSLIPDALYRAEDQKKYFDFNHDAEASGALRADKLFNLEARNIYILPLELEQYFSGRFPKIKFLHGTTIWLESMMIQNPGSAGQKIHLNLGSNRFAMAVTKGKELLFHNSFYYQTPEDLLYYLLFSIKQLNLDPNTVPLEIIGNQEKSSSLLEMIGKYVTNTKLAERPANFEYSAVFNQVPDHFFTNLFNQLLCA